VPQEREAEYPVLRGSRASAHVQTKDVVQQGGEEEIRGCGEVTPRRSSCLDHWCCRVHHIKVVDRYDRSDCCIGYEWTKFDGIFLWLGSGDRVAVMMPFCAIPFLYHALNLNVYRLWL
jgi:hypothetical protein